MMNTKKRGSRFAPAKLSLSVAAALAAFSMTPAQAFLVDTGNPDLAIRWDNQLRYNVGFRMEKPNPEFANLASYDETEGQFKRGDIVTNRANLFSEFDFTYKETYGFRVSGALWSEHAYGDTSKTNPLLSSSYGANAPMSNYGPSGLYSPYARRFVTGSSAEFVDAFVFGKFELGNTLLNVKVGQHNVSWGESLFTAADGINFGQGPIDTVKAATSTGAVEAKELFMPLNQISAQWTLTKELSLMAQKQFDWKPFRLVPGGTYFASGDGSGLGTANPQCASASVGGGCIVYLDSIIPGRNKSGDYGIGLKWKPDWLDGTFGFYYRKFDEKLPWSISQLQNRNPTNPSNLATRLVYARDTELYGVSLGTQVSGISVGAEISQRKNTALSSVSGFFAGSSGTNPATAAYFASANANIPLTQTPDYSLVEGARGDTWHAVVNFVYLLPNIALWDAGALQGELAYQRLDKVTSNPNVFFSEDYACKFGYATFAAGARSKADGCATKDSFAMNLGFSPEWTQVLPNWNLKMPTSLSYGLKGNSPALGGSAENAYKWSIGLVATYSVVYEFGMAYTDSHAKYKTVTGAASNGGVAGTPVMFTKNGSADMNNRAWLSLYFKTSF